MSRYLFQVSYSQEAWKSMIAKPQNRLDLVGEMLSSHGITIVDGYATFEDMDTNETRTFEAPIPDVITNLCNILEKHI